MMSPIAVIAIFGFFPLVLYLFSTYGGRKAATAAFILGWLFLPVANIPLPALSSFSKIHAICFAILLGTLVFDSDRFSNFHWSKIDLPITCYCLAPMLASLSNGLGLYDGIAATRDQTVTYGLPYFVGRLYLTNLEELKDVALWFFLGGLIYIPFCLLEMRISPQLHMKVYGYYQFYDFSQSLRGGGYRPLVFMNHGIMVGMWMAMASLSGFWLYYTGVLRDEFGPKSRILLICLLFTSFAMKSFGAFMLLLIGAAVLVVTTFLRKPILILLVCILPMLYLTARSSGIWNGDNLVKEIAKFSEERAESLRFRLENENILRDKALQAPIFGWGGWGRARVYDEEGKDISVTDGQWIIVLGNLGMFGLTAMTLSVLLPVFLLLQKIPARRWAEKQIAPAAALAVALAMYMIDFLPDAMPNPTFMFIAGGLSSFYEASPSAIFTEDDDSEIEEYLDLPLTPRTRFI